ncbi:MAG: STAS domain-containing protein [Phycisphaeraceae bacterium]|nr:STAS domain-containing protein [Phycisphaeraceae bacterium]MBX3409081.1 STAS domain-containing protein [Phycisphaeraceae bacterium]
MAEKGPIVVNVRQIDGAAVVAPEGEVGYHEAPTLRQALREAFDRKPARLVADLSGVTYMATPGLATLVEALQISKRTQTPLVLCALSGRVRAVFEIARLHTVFTIAEDLQSALSPKA